MSAERVEIECRDGYVIIDGCEYFDHGDFRTEMIDAIRQQARDLYQLRAENAALLAANRDLKMHFDALKGDYDEAAHFARHFIRDDPSITPRGAIIRLGDKCTSLLVRLQQAEARLAEIAARADARIAELEQSVTVRDTEIARLETDLELARVNAARYFWLRDDWYLSGTEDRCLDEVLDLSHRVTPSKMDAAIDAARAGNGGVV